MATISVKDMTPIDTAEVPVLLISTIAETVKCRRVIVILKRRLSWKTEVEPFKSDVSCSRFINCLIQRKDQNEDAQEVSSNFMKNDNDNVQKDKLSIPETEKEQKMLEEGVLNKEIVELSPATSEVKVTNVDAYCTVEDLKCAMVAQYPDLSDIVEGSLFSINSDYTYPEAPIYLGDELTLVSPITDNNKFLSHNFKNQENFDGKLFQDFVYESLLDMKSKLLKINDSWRTEIIKCILLIWKVQLQYIQKIVNDNIFQFNNKLLSIIQQLINFLKNKIEEWNGKFCRTKFSFNKISVHEKVCALSSFEVPFHLNTVDGSASSVVPFPLMTQPLAQQRGTNNLCKIMNLSNQQILKKDSELNGADCSLIDLIDCRIFLLDVIGGARLYKIQNSTIWLGAVSSSVTVYECTKTTLFICAQQIRIHKSKDLILYIKVLSSPVIEKCRDIYFAPYSRKYHKQAEQWKSAGLNFGNEEETELWHDVIDFDWQKKQKSPHWNILSLDDRVLNSTSYFDIPLE